MFSNMFGIFLAILSIFVTFGLVVFVHELGHFVFARLAGVGVEAFAIGMGPPIFVWKPGVTEYSIRWFPVGGYVKLHQMIRDEAEEEERETARAAAENTDGEAPSSSSLPAKKGIGEDVHQDMAALYQKGLLVKLSVFGGGVFFNFLTAIAAIALLFTIGIRSFVTPLVIGELKPESPAFVTGLRTGDRIVRAGGQPVKYEKELSKILTGIVEEGGAPEGFDIEVDRAGQAVPIRLAAITGATRAEREKSMKKSLSVVSEALDVPPYVGEIIPNMPAEASGLQVGDTIMAVNGQPVSYWQSVREAILNSVNKPLELTIRREGTPEAVRILVKPREDPLNPGKGQIGIAPGGPVMELYSEPVLTAIAKAPGRTWGQIVNMVDQHIKFFGNATFKGVRENVGGPLMIGQLTYKKATRGFRELLDWFITINIILGIMNLLPIPVLDGGFIVLSFIEAVIRRPVPARIMGPVYVVFWFALVSLMVLISFQDVLRFLGPKM